MVHGGSYHNTHEREIAQNQNDGTDKCIQCGRQDNMLYRLTEYGVRKEIW
jgi:hypothetical protein